MSSNRVGCRISNVKPHSDCARLWKSNQINPLCAVPGFFGKTGGEGAENIRKTVQTEDEHNRAAAPDYQSIDY